MPFIERSVLPFLEALKAADDQKVLRIFLVPRLERTWYPLRVTSQRIRWGILPPHFSLFLRRELYQLVGDFRYREHRNVACDILWLLDLAIKKPGVRIKVLPNHHLRMEYGGASTGSLNAVREQFLVVHRYARANARHLRFWFLYSPLRTLSKVFQFRFVEGVRILLSGWVGRA